MEYKNVGNHAIDLASGLVLAPGETAELSEDAVKDPHNVSLVDDGFLIPCGQTTVNATEDAIELAEANGLDLSQIAGSGTSGRITKRDVEKHLEASKTEEVS